MCVCMRVMSVYIRCVYIDMCVCLKCVTVYIQYISIYISIYDDIYGIYQFIQLLTYMYTTHTLALTLTHTHTLALTLTLTLTLTLALTLTLTLTLTDIYTTHMHGVYGLMCVYIIRYVYTDIVMCIYTIACYQLYTIINICMH
ncbi:hypothetical protein AMTRI_Chr13g87430 [Amborella trichopoda]